MNHTRSVLMAAAIAFIPATLWANAGTPLMWASWFHLFLGNAILGIWEASLIGWVCKRIEGRQVLILIAANYASAFFGGVPLADAIRLNPEVTIENIHEWLTYALLLAFLLTLLIEFPFIWFALRSVARPCRQALKATLLVHCVSYPLVIGGYWMVSGTSMLTELQVVSPGELTTKDNYTLYYISRNGKRVLQVPLDQPSVPAELAVVSAKDGDARLFARPNDDVGFDLYLLRGYPRSLSILDAKGNLIKESFAMRAPVERGGDFPTGSWFNFGPVQSLAEKSDWKFGTGFWAWTGIYGDNSKTKQQVRYSMEMPLAVWPIRNATQLEGDYVVFQLGRDQICILHPESKRIALLARGKGPLVAVPHASNQSKIRPEGNASR